MKKIINLITVFLSCVIVGCAVCFVGCSSGSESDTYLHLIDFSKCEIGYEIPVHPDFEFDYVLSGDHTIHISEISAVLLKKNFDSENNTVDSLYPYRIEISVYGSTTDSEIFGKTVTFMFHFIPDFTNTMSINVQIDDEGNMYGQSRFSAYEFAYVGLYIIS